MASICGSKRRSGHVPVSTSTSSPPDHLVKSGRSMRPEQRQKRGSPQEPPQSLRGGQCRTSAFRLLAPGSARSVSTSQNGNGEASVSLIQEGGPIAVLDRFGVA